MKQPLLSVKDLQIIFPHRLGDFMAVKRFDLDVGRGEIVGLIGESGAGKSTVGNAIMGLLAHPGRVTAGCITLNGERINTNDRTQMSALRGRKIGMIFQDPMTSLNPLMTIGDQLSESIAYLLGLEAKDAREEAARRLQHVGIPDINQRMKQYPHEFSGGMRQRVVIALALAGDPDLLIADEPTTALDVSVQKHVLDLMKRLCSERNLGVILITHDMGVIAETTKRVYVMRHGNVMESGPTRKILTKPTNSYTKQLIAAIPSIDRREARFCQPKAHAKSHIKSHVKPQGNDYVGDIDQWLLAGHSHKFSGTYLKTTALTKDFMIHSQGFSMRKSWFRAVDVPGFSMERGEVLGVVGESGSGKSTLGRLLTGLLPISTGRVTYTDHGPLDDLKTQGAQKAFRRDIQIIFQDPYSSLNGRMRIDRILGEPIRFHGLARRKEIPNLVQTLLERVGLDGDAGRKYPHQFSGGQRQRIGIARALAVKPRFLLCDEPTSALDVSIQAEMLALLMELKRSLGLTIIFVSHDLAVIRQVSDRIIVMRHGKIEEFNETEALFTAPKSDYTRMLLETAPRINRIQSIGGTA